MLIALISQFSYEQRMSSEIEKTEIKEQPLRRRACKFFKVLSMPRKCSLIVRTYVLADLARILIHFNQEDHVEHLSSIISLARTLKILMD